MKTIEILFLSFVVLVISGCANIKPERDSQGNVIGVSASKFMADLAYKQTIKYSPEGKILERTEEYETRTNADRILDSATKLTGQLVDGASKVMP